MQKFLSAILALLLTACVAPDKKTSENNEDNLVGYTVIGDPSDRIFFDYNSSLILPEGAATIEYIANWLLKNSEIKILVEGHTDERGTREYNLALGERRAESVRNHLIAEGIAPERVSIISYGKERPAALSHDERSWAQNRRAVFVIAR